MATQKPTMIEKTFFEPSKKDLSADLPFARSCIEDLWLSTTFGKVHCWLLRTKLPRKGFILHFHGNAMNITTHVTHINWLTEHGFDVLTWDYAGYGQSEGAPTFTAVRHQSFEILEFAQGLNTDNSLFGVIGQSLGGVFASTAVAQSNLQVDFLVLDGVFCSLHAIAAHHFCKGNHLLQIPVAAILKFLIRSDLAVEGWVDTIRCPILFTHGRKDGVAPIELARQAYERIAARSDTDFIKFDADHCEVFRHDIGKARAQLLQWIEDSVCKIA